MTRQIEYGPSIIIDMGNNKITNMADGVAADDAATVGQLGAGGSTWSVLTNQSVPDLIFDGHGDVIMVQS